MTNIDFTLSMKTNNKQTQDVSTVLGNLQNGQYMEVYELISMTKPIAPYFDIDAKAENFPDFDEMYQRREEILEETLSYLRGIFGKDCEFAISEANQEGLKLSYHLKITNRQTTMAEMYNVSRKFKAPLDKAVYHSRGATNPRKFRTILSKKRASTGF
jgi:hypothetical protein